MGGPTALTREYVGYRVARREVLWAAGQNANKVGLLERLETWPERRFRNKVVGLPIDSGESPLTEDDSRAICTSEDILPVTIDDEIAIAAKYASDIKVAGLDWAMNSNESTPSYTNMAIWAIHRRKMRLIYAHKFVGLGATDPDVILRFIGDRMDRFGVHLLAADYGVGYFEDQRLKSMFPDRVATIHYTGSSVGKVATRWDPAGQKYMVPRTASLDEFVSAVKHKEVELPMYENVREYVSDWLRVVLEITESTRTVVYRRTGTDDFFHVGNYAHLAMRMVNGHLYRHREPTDNDDSIGLSTPLGV